MGQIRKINDQYFIEFYARGLLYSQIGGSSEEEARFMLEMIEAKIAQGEALTIVRQIDLGVFFEKFVEYSKDRFSLKSLERFKRMWQHFVIFLKNNYPLVTQLSQITPIVLESYKSALMNSQEPKVCNFTILLLREVMEYGIKIGFLNDNPSLHVRLLKLPMRAQKENNRSQMARELLSKGVGLEKMCSLLNLKDVAQIMYWSNFIPIERMDVYS